MNRLLDVIVMGKAAPQGSKRHVGHGRMIEQSQRVGPWREAVKAAILNQPTRERYEGPVVAVICFTFDKPQSAPKRRQTWPITRSSGDIDKLLRSTFDAITDCGVWRDDSQVVEVRAYKRWTLPSETPYAHISLWSEDQDEQQNDDDDREHPAADVHQKVTSAPPAQS